MIRKLFLCTGLSLTLLACALVNGLLLGTPTPLPSKTPHPKKTSTIALSATPEPTEIPTIVLSDTSEPALSLTPIPLLPATSLTPAPTGLSVTPTPTQITGLDCKLLWQSPANDSAFNTEQKFTAGWSVENNGTATWDASSFEFIYVGGSKMDLGDVVHLQTSVPPGESVVLSVSMKAPQNPGAYTTYWAIRQGNTYFCRLKLQIYAQ